MDRLVEIVVRQDDDDGPEDLLAHEPRIERRLGHDGGRQLRALALSTEQDAGTVPPCLREPDLDARRGGLVHERSDVRRRVHRIPYDEVARHLDQPCGERVEDLAVHDHPLHGVAALPGVREASSDAGGCRHVERRVAVNDVRRVPAELERYAAQPRAANDGLAGVTAAGQRVHADPSVVEERGHRLSIPRHDVDGASRRTGLLHDHRDVERRQGRLAGRLHDDRISRSEGRRDLVRHEVERSVERGDGSDEADRLPDGDGQHALVLGRGIGDRHGAEMRLSGGRRSAHRPCGATNLPKRVLPCLAGLPRDGDRVLIGPIGDQIRGATQDRGSFVGGQGRHRRLSAHGGIDGTAHVGFSRDRDAGHH